MKFNYLFTVAALVLAQSAFAQSAPQENVALKNAGSPSAYPENRTTAPTVDPMVYKRKQEEVANQNYKNDKNAADASHKDQLNQAKAHRDIHKARAKHESKAIDKAIEKSDQQR